MPPPPPSPKEGTREYESNGIRNFIEIKIADLSGADLAIKAS